MVHEAHDKLVNELFKSLAPLFNELLFKDAVILPKGELPSKSLPGQRRNNDLRVGTQTAPALTTSITS